MEHLLLTEDDSTIAMGLEYSLRREGFAVTVTENVRGAKKALDETRFDLLLLDIALPDGTGFEIFDFAKKICDSPVIFLTAGSDEVSVVMGLDMGADDYITKPFRVRELISRIRTVLRRCGKEKQGDGSLTSGALSIYPAQAKVYKNGAELFLTALEYRLLLIFMSNEGQLLTRPQILERIWDSSGEYVNDNTLTVYIKRLREKIEDDPADPKLLKTVRGLGYQLG